MIKLPNEADLLEHIRASLDAVSEEDAPDWFVRIASQLATRVRPIGLTCRARGKPEPCDGEEFLWDFIAFIDANDGTPNDDRFWAQAAIVGEVEWNMANYEIDRDFEKLLHAESLTCFMTFEKRSSEEAARKIDWLEKAVRRRQKYARLRGHMRPTAYLLSCWVRDEHRFEHKEVLPEAV